MTRARNAYKKKPPRAFAARGCEPQAACTDRPWRRERGPATGTCLHKGRAVCKKRRGPLPIGQGAVSDKQPVSTGCGRESVTKWSGIYKKGALRLFGEGLRESSSDLLSRARGPGTIGDEGLDFRVRKGNGYDPLSVTAETISSATTCCRKSLLKHSLEAGGSGLLTQPIEPNR